MIIYVIIYHIRNNKNYNIDMSIKYNTIITAIISTFSTAEKEKRKRMYNNYSIYSYIESISQEKKKEIIIYKYILLNPAIREKEYPI